MKFINVVVTHNDVLDENYLFDDSGKAEQKFVELCEKYFTAAWDSLDVNGQQLVLDDGYFTCGHSSVYLSWPELNFSVLDGVSR